MRREDRGRIIGRSVESSNILDQAALYSAQQVFFDSDQDILTRTNMDLKVVEATKAWSHCLAKSGFSYASPVEARRSAEGSSSAETIKLAVADYGCRNSSNYENTRLATSEALTADWLEKHPEAVSELKGQKARIVATAKAYLTSH